MYKVFFITFGCKVNRYETECMKSEFLRYGYEISKDLKSADAVVINSCTVTSSGDSKVITALKKTRKQVPDTVIALTGCFPQANRIEAENISEADIVTGTKNRSLLPELVTECLQKRSRKVMIADYSKDDPFECLDCPSFGNNTRAFIKIQDGCNQFCTYCIIPYARGRCRSKPIDTVRSEIRAMAEIGKQEIVLTGINLAFYGTEYGLDLADAVEVCAETDGIKRIRLGSLEPEMMSDRLLERLKSTPQFCPQFHLSLQSGCTKTLKAMNRKYTAEEYYELTQRIRKFFPECSFTTDIMVGFPDETDEDFRQSLDFVKKVGFSRVHVFRYSRRHGTPADRMENQVSEQTKIQRASLMTATAMECEAKYLESLVGKTVEVLFERENCTDFHQGYSADYTLIKIPRINIEKSLRNQIFCVTIEESRSDFCIGTLAESR